MYITLSQFRVEGDGTAFDEWFLPLADKMGALPGNILYRMLHDPNPALREQAALAWCTWESATPSWPPTSGLSPRFTDHAFRMAFARIVTHYVSHDAWMEDGVLLRNAAALADIPGIMVNGRYDLQAPIGWAYDLKQAWPTAQLVIVDNAGHDPSNAGITKELILATNHFANPAG